MLIAKGQFASRKLAIAGFYCCSPFKLIRGSDKARAHTMAVSEIEQLRAQIAEMGGFLSLCT